MKLAKWEIEKRPNDKARLKVSFKSKMRQPAVFKLTKGTADDYEPFEMFEDDRGELTGFLFAIAEIAWDCGWRPRGLVATLAHVATNYKEPPEEK